MPPLTPLARADAMLVDQHARLSAAEARRYEVRYHRDLRPDAYLHWRLYVYGPGHWCVGSGYAGAFKSATEAHAAGRKWLAEGRT